MAVTDDIRSESTERDPALARVEEEIARTRARVAGNIVALRRELARRVDWRQWMRKRPYQFLLGAFVLGALLGGRRRRRQDETT